MSATAPRHTVADFLDRLADGRSGDEEWRALAVAHCEDAVLEDARCRCMRLAIAAPPWRDRSAAGREGFRALASELRDSGWA
ncbi:hypothetical protein OJF2_36300 [Aquisphaera giovannonii]|uniref:Uncharacterized protein n=1 Tax=Aquisphaera giovannonii TaxID=406548 RepID=A0A5B9W4N5_9BACT|nr:hypothetical protein [Aquisphaera giovannonii]QEH35085.1 hypothetical protein OJF2_36300 [Aquisphaera giovannonii]